MIYKPKYKKTLKEGVLLDSLPTDIISNIIIFNTSLGNNPSIPDIYDIPFLAKIVNRRFNYLKDQLKQIGKIEDIESNDLYSGLSELIFKCKKIERDHRDKLEKLCYNFVIDTFSIPEETIILNICLKDKIEFADNSIQLSPVEDDDIVLYDLHDAMVIKKEVYKRRLLNVLCVGGGMEIAKHALSILKNDINNINPDLFDLYRKILLINEYLIFEKYDIKLSDDNKKQLGTVEVKLGNTEYKTTISSQGTIFPALLTETIRGLFELFISHGLPCDKNLALNVLHKSDYLKAEPWDMRFGPSLWNLCVESFNDISSKEIPYLLKRISILDIDKFNFLMKEVFAKTKKGKEIMSILSKKAKNDMEYIRFVDKMDKMKINKSIITDEYIHLDEL